MSHRICPWVLAGAVAWQGIVAAQDAKPSKPAKAPGASRWALLIGVDDYAEAQKLRFAGADMRALRDQLVAAGFPKDQVFLLEDKAVENKYRPLKANIERQLELVLGLVDREDLLLVAFSGHGIHRGGKSWLCPAEVRLGDTGTMIPLDAVYDRLQKCPAALKLLLVDACRDDPRLEGQRSLTTASDPKQFAESLERPPEGILLLSSCAPGQVSMEEKEFGHGVFMHFVLQGLQGKADADNNGRVSLTELYRYANRETKVYVARKFNGYQTPALKGDIADDFDLSQVVGGPRELINSIGMKMVLIPAGEFMMGSPEGEGDSDEHPQHRVRIARPFYLGCYEVTVGQFRQFVSDSAFKTDAEKDGKGGYGMDPGEGSSSQKAEYTWRNAGFAQTDEHPVVNVSWNDAVAFCGWLSRKEGKTYRLPTEAEWEYACRAGTQTRYYHGDDPEGLALVGNVSDGTAKAKFPKWTTISAEDGYVFTAPVGRFRANAFGLYDMHGNAYERCGDRYAEDYYGKSPPEDPIGPDSGSLRVLRGGSWGDGPFSTRSANRNGSSPDFRSCSTGFRVARTP